MYLVFQVQIKHFNSDNCQGNISQFYFFFFRFISTNTFYFLLVLVSVDSNSAGYVRAHQNRVVLVSLYINNLFYFLFQISVQALQSDTEAAGWLHHRRGKPSMFLNKENICENTNLGEISVLLLILSLPADPLSHTARRYQRTGGEDRWDSSALYTRRAL